MVEEKRLSIFPSVFGYEWSASGNGGRSGNTSSRRKLFVKTAVSDVRKKWLDVLSDLNVCSQKGLVEMFDGSIGAGSVFMPHGGKYQMTETQTMVAKLPVLKGDCDTVTMMAYGFDPYLSSWSPYHGSIYAVLESISRIVAAGGDYSKIRMTYQELLPQNERGSKALEPAVCSTPRSI